MLTLKNLIAPGGHLRGAGATLSSGGAGQPLPFKAKALWHANPEFFVREIVKTTKMYLMTETHGRTRTALV